MIRWHLVFLCRNKFLQILKYCPLPRTILMSLHRGDDLPEYKLSIAWDKILQHLSRKPLQYFVVHLSKMCPRLCMFLLSESQKLMSFSDNLLFCWCTAVSGDCENLLLFTFCNKRYIHTRSEFIPLWKKTASHASNMIRSLPG